MKSVLLFKRFPGEFRGKILLVFLLIGVSGYAETGSDRKLFERILKNNWGIKTVDASIEQLTIRGEETPLRSRGRFRAGSGGRFRIDFTSPEEQLVIYNGRDLRWYFRKEKLLYIYPGIESGKVLSSAPLEKYRNDINRRFSIKYMGFRFYRFFRIVDLYRLREKKRGRDIFLWIDSSRGVLLKRVLKDRKGVEYMKEEFRNYTKVSGFLFPRSVEVMVRTDEGITTSITRYIHVVVNRVLSEKLFEMAIPAGATKKIINE
jgi:outer membrane lipoprotein-sorting protein